MSDLCKLLKFKYEIDYIKLNSYEGQEQGNMLFNPKDIEEHKDKKNVVFIDELVDTGSSMNCLKKIIPQALCVTIFSKQKYPDYCGCDFIPKAWLVGYGLDDDGYKRGWVHLFCKRELMKPEVF